eukprot:33115-Prymnesium_polylepis.1
MPFHTGLQPGANESWGDVSTMVPDPPTQRNFRKRCRVSCALARSTLKSSTTTFGTGKFECTLIIWDSHSSAIRVSRTTGRERQQRGGSEGQ